MLTLGLAHLNMASRRRAVCSSKVKQYEVIYAASNRNGVHKRGYRAVTFFALSADASLVTRKENVSRSKAMSKQVNASAAKTELRRHIGFLLPFSVSFQPSHRINSFWQAML
jgi:hypothetical protein